MMGNKGGAKGSVRQVEGEAHQAIFWPLIKGMAAN